MEFEILLNDVKIIFLGSLIVGLLYYSTNDITLLGYGIGGMLIAVALYHIYILYIYYSEHMKDEEENNEDN